MTERDELTYRKLRGEKLTASEQKLLDALNKSQALVMAKYRDSIPQEALNAANEIRQLYRQRLIMSDEEAEGVVSELRSLADKIQQREIDVQAMSWDREGNVSILELRILRPEEDTKPF